MHCCAPTLPLFVPETMDNESSEEDDSFLIDANAKGGNFCQAYKDEVDRGLEKEKRKLHKIYDEKIQLDDVTSEKEGDQFEERKKEMKKESRKELQASILDSYVLQDLYWCREVWKGKGRSKAVYFPCAKILRDQLQYIENIDMDKVNSVDRRTVWKLGVKGGQPSVQCQWYVMKGDCVQFDPQGEDFLHYVHQIGDLSSLIADEVVPGPVPEGSVPTNAGIIAKTHANKHKKEFVAAFKEAMKIYRHAKEKCDIVNAEKLKSPENVAVYEDSTQSQPLGRPRAKKRRNVSTSKIKISTRKLKLQVGDILRYDNVMSGTLGSAKAKRECRVVEITTDATNWLKLEDNGEEYLSYENDIIVQVMRHKGKNWLDGRKFSCFTPGTPNKLSGVKTKNEKCRDIVIDGQQKMKEGLKKRKRGAK